LERQSLEDRVTRGILVEMKWLGAEFGGESLYLLLGYPQFARAGGVAIAW
jgi:hypothetical protein